MRSKSAIVVAVLSIFGMSSSLVMANPADPVQRLAHNHADAKDMDGKTKGVIGEDGKVKSGAAKKSKSDGDKGGKGGKDKMNSHTHMSKDGGDKGDKGGGKDKMMDAHMHKDGGDKGGKVKMDAAVGKDAEQMKQMQDAHKGMKH